MFDLIFYIFAFITVVGAAVTAIHRNIVYAAFALLFTFVGVAGLYVMANADFLAVTQMMVYVGGILILLIFGVMLTNRIQSANIVVNAGPKPVVAILSLGLLAILCAAFFGPSATHSEKSKDGKTASVSSWSNYTQQPWAATQWNKDANERILSEKFGAPSEVKTKEGSSGTSVEIGKLLLSDYLLPFEIVSIVLLVALIGATMIARKEPTLEEEALSESLS